MRSFQDSIEKLLWPEKRDKDPVLGDKVPGLIDRTTERSFVRVARRATFPSCCGRCSAGPIAISPGSSARAAGS